MKLYYMPASPPSRSVLMTIRCLELEVEIIPLDLLKGDQKTPDFLKVNPIGQIPVLDDDGLILCESRAIMAYLVNAKKPGNSLYPTDPRKRAVVDSRLYFDASYIFETIRTALIPLFYKGEKEVPTELREKFKTALKFLDNILAEKSYVAGDEPTLADISILSNIMHLKYCFGGIGNVPNIEAWHKRCESLPGYEENVNAGKDMEKICEQAGIKLAPLE